MEQNPSKVLNYLLYLFLIFPISNIFAQSVWREASFNDFKDEQFLDAGSNCYVSAKGRIQMITRWDFNNDGFLDIFLPVSHGQTEKENTYIYIYLNNGSDFNARSRIDLPGGGSRDGLIADFNKDGFNDLTVVNFKDSHHPKIPVWIYYGTEKGYTPYNRVELPAEEGKVAQYRARLFTPNGAATPYLTAVEIVFVKE